MSFIFTILSRPLSFVIHPKYKVIMNTSEGIIFFDGVCGLCNGFIDFVMVADKNERFKFSPLQSDYAKSQLPEEAIKEMGSMIVKIDGRTYSKSAGVMAVLKELGGFWNLLSVGRFLPQIFRDLAYDLVAENRYKLFGKKDTCRLPSPEERKRFIL